MKSILDPTFRYTPSVETDLRRTFARVRRELRAQGPKTGPEVSTRGNVLALQPRQALPSGAR